jgi:hypothetical protein
MDEDDLEPDGKLFRGRGCSSARISSLERRWPRLDGSRIPDPRTKRKVESCRSGILDLIKFTQICVLHLARCYNFQKRSNVHILFSFLSYIFNCRPICKVQRKRAGGPVIDDNNDNKNYYYSNNIGLY